MESASEISARLRQLPIDEVGALIVRVSRVAVLIALVAVTSTALAQTKGCKATILFRAGNSVRIDHFGTTTEVYEVILAGRLGGQKVKFNLCDLAQVDFTNPAKTYGLAGFSATPDLGVAIVTNKQGKRFTVTDAMIVNFGSFEYTYQDPVTGKLVATQAAIKNDVASIIIGGGSGAAHEGQMKMDPATHEYFPGTYLYDPYTGAELIWANPPQ